MENDQQQKVVQFSGDEFLKIAEIAQPFLERGVSSDTPKFAIFMGGIASGKTTARREKYAEGYVHFDFGEIHLAFEKVVGKSNPRITEYTLFVSDMILRESISKKKNIVIEIIGDNYDLIAPVIDKMKKIGYTPDVVGLVSDIEESRKRHLKATAEEKDYISAFYTQEPTLSIFYHQLELGSMPKTS